MEPGGTHGAQRAGPAQELAALSKSWLTLGCPALPAGPLALLADSSGEEGAWGRSPGQFKCMWLIVQGFVHAAQALAAHCALHTAHCCIAVRTTLRWLQN